MKSLIQVLVSLSLFSSQAFAIGRCERCFREETSKSIFEKLSTSNMFAKIPAKPNWEKVNQILSAQKMGTQTTEEWVADFIRRQRKNETSFEEQLALIAIINPERGIPALRRIKAANMIYFRQLMFGQKQWRPMKYAFPLDIPFKKFQYNIGLPKNVKDVEKTFLKILDELSPKVPSLFDPIKKEGLNVQNYQKAWIDKQNLLDIHRAELISIYEEYRKFLDKPMTLDNFASYYGKNFGPDLDIAYSKGLITQDSSVEDALAALKVQAGEENTGLYVWSLAKATFGLTIMTSFMFFFDEMKDALIKILMKNDAATLRQNRDKKRMDDLSKKVEQTAELMLTQAEKIQLENEYPYSELIKYPYNPLDPLLLNSTGKTDEEKYPCDPYGAVYKQSQITKDAEELRSIINGYISNPRMEETSQLCQYVLRLQIFKSKK